MFTNLSAAPLWAFDMDAVDELHEIQLLLVYRLRLTVNRRTVTLTCLAMPDQWKIILTVDYCLRSAILVR